MGAVVPDSPAPLAFAPIGDIPYPKVDLRAPGDPVPAILNAPEFPRTTRYFGSAPSVTRSLLTDRSQALLYTLIRNLRPEHVVEIGTYKGGTAECLSRALDANGFGTLHTVSPFDVKRFGPIFSQWPEKLRRRTRYHAIDSMMFFMETDREHIRPGIVLVDGNHDYEFAKFDIQAAARRLTPGGFILIDNVSQAGPFWAAAEFLAANPAWVDCGARFVAPDKTRAFDDNRTRVAETDFYILRAPLAYAVGQIPRTFGALPWNERPVTGLRIASSGRPPKGMLHVECILRCFSEMRIDELVGRTSRLVDGGAMEWDIAFDKPIVSQGTFDRYAVEPWLIWAGDGPMLLAAEPAPY
jgi:predicted O-methyltransferase YrrM